MPMLRRMQDMYRSGDLQRTPDWMKQPMDSKSFNEMIGLPVHPKTGEPNRFYEYQLMLDNDRYRYQAIPKSNKIGITEIMLRRIIRKSYYDCKGFQILLLAQRYEMALENMRRLQRIVRGSNVLASTVNESKTRYDKLVNIFGSEIIAVPASASAIRGYPRIKHVFIDEPSHFGLLDDEDILAAASSRLANTNGTMDLCSTPRGQRGFFYRIVISAETIKNFPWKVFRLPYTVALGKLINQDFIDEERLARGPLFPQEYEAEFLTSSSAAIPQEYLDPTNLDDYEGAML